jgi:hypothetical protein
VSNVLTLGAGSTIDSSIDVGNADTLDGNDGSYYAKATHFHSTLTAGTGLGGGTYDGTAAATFAVQYGTVAGTAVQGNQTAKITAGTGLTGGIPSDALGDGFSATLDVAGGNGITASADSLGLGPLTANWNQTGAFDLVLANAGADILMLETGGGTDYGTLDMGVLSGTQTYTFTGTGGDVWTSGNDGAGSGLNADLLDGEHSSYFMKGTTDNWVNITGDTMTGKLNLPKSLTTGAGLNLGSAGVAPTAPWDGDIWLTTGGLGAYFNGYKAGFLDTTPQPQTKTGRLTLVDGVGTALDVTGTSTAAQFATSTPWSNAFLASSGTGIIANGSDKGATFRDDGSALANIATIDYGIEATGTTGARFANTAGTAETKIAYFFAGIEATGTAVGGAFDDSDSSGYAYVAYGDYGIDAQGNTAGGYFHDANSSGYARVGYGDYGIAGYGDVIGGYFECTDAGGGSNAYIGRKWDSGGGVYQYWGIRAFGDSGGGHFGQNSPGTGYARVAWADTGIEGYGNYAGGYFEDRTSGTNNTVGYMTYKDYSTGTNSFVQNHPGDPSKVIVYAAPEASEVATFTRGQARLQAGRATVKLDSTFAWVTNPDIGLTVHLTPHGEAIPLAVESLTTSELVVKGPAEGAKDIAFDYLVFGLRIGFEELSVVQEKTQEAWIPSMEDHRDLFRRMPELRNFNALERFKVMRSEMGEAPVSLVHAETLKEAVHEFQYGIDPSPSMTRRGSRLHARPGPIDQESRLDSLGRGSAGVTSTANATSVQNRPPQDHSDSAEASGKKEVAAVELLPLLPVEEEVDEGDVLVLIPQNGEELYRCHLALDPSVVGIADGPAQTEPESTRLVARLRLTGLARCKVDATLAPIQRGDLLTTSATPGHAMRAQPKVIEGVPIYTSGTIIGKALEPLASGTGLIKVLVMLR